MLTSLRCPCDHNPAPASRRQDEPGLDDCENSETGRALHDGLRDDFVYAVVVIVDKAAHCPVSPIHNLRVPVQVGLCLNGKLRG